MRSSSSIISSRQHRKGLESARSIRRLGNKRICSGSKGEGSQGLGRNPDAVFGGSEDEFMGARAKNNKVRRCSEIQDHNGYLMQWYQRCVVPLTLM
jgi:hypothetical protein